MRVHVRTGDRAEVAACGADANARLELHQSRLSCHAEVGGLVPRRTRSARCYRKAMTVKIHLQRPHVSAYRAEGQIVRIKCRNRKAKMDI